VGRTGGSGGWLNGGSGREKKGKSSEKRANQKRIKLYTQKHRSNVLNKYIHTIGDIENLFSGVGRTITGCVLANPIFCFPRYLAQKIVSTPFDHRIQLY
jgi:hypothetical protein